VFVDHYGDLHDPDYRQFPVVTTRPKWEQGDHDDDLAEEDEDVVDRRHSSRVPPITSYKPSYAYNYGYDVTTVSPASYASALDDAVEESPFVDESEKECVSISKKCRHKHSKSIHDEKHSLATEKPTADAAEPTSPRADYNPSEYGQDEWT